MSNSITAAVGSPDDLRSSIWRLWVQGDDVYFGARQILPILKVSLHKSGKWHIAWAKNAAIKEKSRFIYRWRRPPPLNNGFVDCITVAVDPYIPKDPFKNKAILDQSIRWVPIALYGQFLVLRVLIAPEETDFDAKRFGPNTTVVGRIKKANREHAVLLAIQTPVTLDLGQRFLKYRSEIKFHSRREDVAPAEIFDQTRGFSISTQCLPHEVPAIYDLTLGWENVSPEPE